MPTLDEIRAWQAKQKLTKEAPPPKDGAANTAFKAPQGPDFGPGPIIPQIAAPAPPAPAVDLAEDVPPPKSMSSTPRPEPWSWIKEVAGNALGMVMGAGPLQAQYAKALRESDQAKKAKKAGRTHILIIEGGEDLGSPSSRKVPVKDLILSPEAEDRMRTRLHGASQATTGAFEGQTQEIAEAGKKTKLHNLETDASRMQSGALMLLNTLGQTGKPPDKRGFMGGLEQGIETGQGMVGGAVGGTAAILKSLGEDIKSAIPGTEGPSHLGRTFFAAPLTTAATVMPLSGPAVKIAKAAVPARAVAAAEALGTRLPRAAAVAGEVAQVAKRGAASAPVGAILGGDVTSVALAAGGAALLPGLAKFLGFVAPEQVAAMKRWMLDRAAQSTKGATAVVREILDEPARVKSEVEAYVKEGAGRVRQGKAYLKDVGIGEIGGGPGVVESEPRVADVLVPKEGGFLAHPQEAVDARRALLEGAEQADARKNAQIEGAKAVKAAIPKIEPGLADKPTPPGSYAAPVSKELEELNATLPRTPEHLQAVTEASAARDAAQANLTALAERIKESRAQGRKIAKGVKLHPRLQAGLDAAKSEVDRTTLAWEEAKKAPTSQAPKWTPELGAFLEDQYAKIQAKTQELLAATDPADKARLFQEVQDLKASRAALGQAPVQAADIAKAQAEVRYANAQRTAAEALDRTKKQLTAPTKAQREELAVLRQEMHAAKAGVREAELMPAREEVGRRARARYRVQELAKASDEAAKAPLELGAGTAATELERDLASGTKILVPSEVKSTLVEDPQFNQAVDNIHATMAESAPDLPRDHVAGKMVEALQDRSLDLLRSPKIRADVLKSMVAKMGKTSKEAEAILDRTMVELATGKRAAATASVGQGLIDDLVEKAVGELAKKPNVLQAAQADAMESLGNDLAGEAAKTKTKFLIDKEQGRFGVDELRKNTPNLVDDTQHVTEAIGREIANGARNPLILPKGLNPDEMAYYLDADPNGYLPNVTTAQIKRLGTFKKTLRRDYVESDIPELHGTYVHKGFESSVGSTLAASTALHEVGSFLNDITKYMKGSVTSRNLSSNKNNLGMNLVYQSLRTGETPMELIAKAVKEGLGWKDYLDGNVTDPAQLRMYRAIARTGLLDTSMIDGELGAIGAGSKLGGIPVVGKALDKFNAALDKGYKLGDVIFKAEETVRGYNKLMTDVSDLSVGREMVLDLGNNRTTRITKLADGTVKLDSPIGGRASVALDSQELANNLAQVAQKTARDVFFDYTDAPLYIEWLRSRSIAALASPFFIWPFKAMDIPGFKKGLVAHLLDYDGGGMYTTTDPALLARNAARSALLSVRRLGLNEAAKTLLPKDQEELTPAMKFDPNSMTLGIIQPGSKTGQVEYRDWSNNNLFAQTDLVWRLGAKGYNAVFGGGLNPDKVDAQVAAAKSLVASAKTPVDKANALSAYEDADHARKVQHIMLHDPELADRKDALKLAGMEGGMIYKFIANNMQGAERGRRVDPADAVRELTRLALGGTVASVLDVAVGAYTPLAEGPVGVFTSRGKAYDTRYTEVEPGWEDSWRDGVKYTIRKVLSIGNRQADLVGKVSHDLSARSKAMVEGVNAQFQREADRRVKQITSDVAKGKILPAEEQAARKNALAELAIAQGKIIKLINEEAAAKTVKTWKQAGRFMHSMSAADVIESSRDAEGRRIEEPDDTKIISPEGD